MAGSWSQFRMARMLGRVSRIYEWRLDQFGPTHKGVLWNDEDAQRLRFELLLQVIDMETAGDDVSINDLGCGYGALFDLLAAEPFFRNGTYRGYDISPKMIAAAKARVTDPRASFLQSAVVKRKADYGLVSGAFNLKLEAPEDTWLSYILDSLTHLWKRSRKGLAFNMLDRRQGVKDWSLYYADPDFFMEFCRDKLGGRAELVDDYPMHEWTILIRR